MRIYRAFLAGLLLACLIGTSAWAASDAPLNYSQAVQAFQTYLDTKTREVQDRSGGYRKPSLPFLLTHGHPTRICVVLVHGLSDSPYFMRDLAETLYARGYNVVAPLISGNGTREDDLGRVSLKDWRQDMDFTLRVSSGLGDQIVFGGFSAGGALSVDIARRYPGKVKGLLLFSPALGMSSFFTPMACLYPHVLVGAKPKEVPTRYRSISNNGICQLCRLIKELGLSRRKPGCSLPIFAVITEYDDVIKLQWTVDWLESRHSPDLRLVAYVKEPPNSKLAFSDPAHETVVPTQNLLHASVVRKTNDYNTEFNPHYAEMAQALVAFMERNFPLSPSRP